MTEHTEELERETDRRQRAEGDLKMLVEMMPDAIYFKDRESRFTRVNQGTVKIFGVKEESELLGKTDADFFSAEEANEYRRDEVQIMETGQPLVNKEECEVWQDGQTHWVLTTKMPLRSVSGEILGTFGLSRDITEIKRQAEQLQNMNEVLRQRNIDLDSFAYVASHDLRSPLRAIDNLAKWIAEDIGDIVAQETRDDLELMQQRVKRMDKLLEDLLQYSRVGRRDGASEHVDVAEEVAEIVELIDRPPEFQIQVEPALPTVFAPRAAIRSVFQNLIENAIKHHHQRNGCVTLSACVNDRLAEFSVSDDGPGIAPQFHQKVFQMFQMLQRRDEVEGSGMGLTLVKKIVESYGGSIQLESGEGRGATFRFTLQRELPSGKPT